eukprot:6048243-Pleurochrysis_carterae.AAC.1
MRTACSSIHNLCMCARTDAAASTHDVKTIVAKRASVRSGVVRRYNRPKKGPRCYQVALIGSLLETTSLRAESGGGGYAESSEGRPAWVAM